MSESEHYEPETLRNFRKVCIISAHMAGSAIKDSLTAASRGRPATVSERADKFDAFLSFNERDVLTHAGLLRMDVAQKLVVERFEMFDANRRSAEALAADKADIAQLEEMEKAAKDRKKGDGNA